MSEHSGTLSRLSVHPASPVLLTKNGPLTTLYSRRMLHLSKQRFLPIWSLRVGEENYFPRTSNHSLDRIKLFACRCYPGRNFDGNQLLGGSISLSPLYATQRIDLHVRIPICFHRNFLRLHNGHVKFTTFRVAGTMLLLRSFK